MSDSQAPWCCTGRAAECPLCTQYGTRVVDPCPGHPPVDANCQTVDTARLHAERRHPDYEYATTRGPRKQWDDVDRPPAGESCDPDYTWSSNVDAGRPGMGWDRFDYTEESYWRRPKRRSETPVDVGSAITIDAAAVLALTFHRPPNNITILGEDGSPLVTIHPSGELEYGPDYTPDEAACAFWDALRRLAPTRCPACGHSGLETP